MVIPWELVASLLVAVGAGAAVARRGGVPVGRVLDEVLAVAVPALVAARLAVVLRDVALTGAWPPPLAWLTITAGLSFPVALLVGAAAGWRRARGWDDDGRHVAAVAVTAAWVGLVAWAAMAVVRDEVAGVPAPVPIGVGWPGRPAPAVPVGLLDAAALAVLVAWARRRAAGDPRRLGAWLLASLAAVHLVGGVLRPTLATVDRDLDVVLGVVALAVGVAVLRRPSRAAARAAVGVGGLVAAVLVGGLLVGAPAPVPPAAAPVEGALRPGGSPAAVPVWDGGALQGFVAAAGRPVVVNLWASWCPPCHAEAPALARAARALGDEVAFVGLLVDDRPVPAQAFVDRYGLAFPTVVDGGAAASLGYAGLPTTVVLDGAGRVVERIVGGVDGGALAAVLSRT